MFWILLCLKVLIHYNVLKDKYIYLYALIISYQEVYVISIYTTKKEGLGRV